MNKNYLIKLSIWLAVFLVLGVLIGRFVYTHDFKWQSPVVLQKPLSINPKAYSVITVVNAAPVVPDTNISPLNATQQYVCNKFGTDCKLALAIAHAENGTGQCDRINWSNKNQTIDIGVFMINSGWIDHNKITASSLFDCKTNVDVAYQIYHANGNSFKDWVVFQNGSYKKYLIN